MWWDILLYVLKLTLWIVAGFQVYWWVNGVGEYGAIHSVFCIGIALMSTTNNK